MSTLYIRICTIKKQNKKPSSPLHQGMCQTTAPKKSVNQKVAHPVNNYDLSFTIQSSRISTLFYFVIYSR